MALEDLTGSSKFIDDLNAANPVVSDDFDEGVDHIQGIKNVLGNSFPNVNAAVTATPAQLNATSTLDTDYAPITRPRRNLIINGCFRVWQRGTSFGLVSTSGYTADRWLWAHQGTATLGWSRQVRPLTNGELDAGHYIYGNVTVADVALGASDYGTLIHRIEGYDAQALTWGGSGARTITISFWHAHTLTGTYSVAIRNAANDRSYVTEYTQSVTNSWEKAEVTIPGCTDGTWEIDTNVGLQVLFPVDSGSNSDTSSINTWLAANKYTSSNQVSGLSSTSYWYKFAQVQFEVGDTATKFELRPLEEEKSLCMRYLQVYSGEVIGNGYASLTTNIRTLIPTPVAMRVTPTSVLTTVGTIRLRGAGQDKIPSAVSVHSKSNNGVCLDWTVTGAVQNYTYALLDAGVDITLSAEP